MQQVQAVENCRSKVKKSTSKINYSSRGLILPMLVEVVISNHRAREDNAHGRSPADDISSSSSTSSLTHDKNLNDGPIASSAAPSKANDHDNDNCIRSEQGARTLEATNRELKQDNENLQKTVKECYQAVTQIQRNADLKQQKLELEITFLRRALADATPSNQRLKICVETREIQQNRSKSGDLHDRAKERHLTSMLTSRNQAVKENCQLRKMVLKSCYSCRSKLSTAIKQAKLAVTEKSSTAAVAADLPLDTSEHSHSTGSRMNELIKEVSSLEEQNSSFSSPRPSPLRKKYDVVTTTLLPVSPRRGILKNSTGVLPPPAVHLTGNHVQPNNATTGSASSIPQQSPHQAPEATLPRIPLLLHRKRVARPLHQKRTARPPPAAHLKRNFVEPNNATTGSASSTPQQSPHQAPKATLPRIPLLLHRKRVAHPLHQKRTARSLHQKRTARPLHVKRIAAVCSKCLVRK
jgi:hypothetical protein